MGKFIGLLSPKLASLSLPALAEVLEPLRSPSFGLIPLGYLQASPMPSPADSDCTSRVPWPLSSSSFLAISSHTHHLSGPVLLDTLWFAHLLLSPLSSGLGTLWV